MVALYDSSHRRISLKLAKPHQVLFIVAIGCRNIRGPFTWSNSRLSIDRIDEEMTVVWDRPAGFELVCSLATIARGDRQQIWRSLTSHLAD